MVWQPGSPEQAGPGERVRLKQVRHPQVRTLLMACALLGIRDVWPGLWSEGTGSHGTAAIVQQSSARSHGDLCQLEGVRVRAQTPSGLQGRITGTEAFCKRHRSIRQANSVT